MADPVRWPGLPRLLADLARVRSTVGDTSAVDRAALSELAQAVGAAAPVRTGYLSGTAHADAGGVLLADYWTFVEAGTSRMPANPFVTRGLDAAQGRVEDLYSEHTEDAFGPVVGSHY